MQRLGKNYLWHPLDHVGELDFKLAPGKSLLAPPTLMTHLHEHYRVPAGKPPRPYGTDLWVGAHDLALNLPRHRCARVRVRRAAPAPLLAASTRPTAQLLHACMQACAHAAHARMCCISRHMHACMRARLPAAACTSYVLGFEVMGFQAFTLLVQFTDTPAGLVISVEVLLGTAASGYDPKNPLFGTEPHLAMLVNAVLFEAVMKPYRLNGEFTAALNAVTRHVVEEFGNLPGACAQLLLLPRVCEHACMGVGVRQRRAKLRQPNPVAAAPAAADAAAPDAAAPDAHARLSRVCAAGVGGERAGQGGGAA